ncbi:formate dehydrogenase accessory sulfurtransferase FdhD [Myxococcota bacterium]|nr:formate dehydrogenase accessory sulfurtransferase FdhD [Myxococcota bacterium]
MVDGTGQVEDLDLVAVEEPLEVRLEGRPLAVTMRTPGHDLDLVAGFLLTEGVVDGADDIVAMAHVDDPADPRGNTVDVRLSPGVPAGRRERAVRELFASSSCGVCGKASIDRVHLQAPPLPGRLEPDPDVIFGLVARLRAGQAAFARTGGLHAAALFTPQGELEAVREDVGRHNAVDKVIGWRLRQDRVPVGERILVVSGRAGFEIVQKAWMAGVPALVAVGAPSSLAVDLANKAGMTLVGFLRDGRYNRYA